MNELANLAERLGADIEQVRQGIGSDPRIGYHFLYAGCGYGGSCFPKDVQALIRTASEAGQGLRYCEAVEAANDAQKARAGAKIVKRFGADLTGMTFALWGLAFKPNTDDMREAPALVLIGELLARGATVGGLRPGGDARSRAHISKARRAFPSPTIMTALEGADALAIVTEWKEFRSPDFAAIKARLKPPAIFDGRNLLRYAHGAQPGFEYFAIGRPDLRGRDGAPA